MHDPSPGLAPQGAAPMTIGRVMTRARLQQAIPRSDTVHWRYLAALEQAARYIGVPRRVVDLVRALFATTQPSDWTADPIAWPSNDHLMRELEVGRTQLKRLIRSARDLGLVDIRESANGKRYGYRDRDGRIVEAYGFSLAPLAYRFEQFSLAAADGRSHDKALVRGRRRLTALRRELVEAARAGITLAPEAADWQKIADLALASWERARYLENVSALEEVLRSMKNQLDDAIIVLEQSVRSEDNDPMGATEGPHNTSTKTNPTSNEDSKGIGRKTADRSPNISRAKARHLDERDVSQVSHQLPATERPTLNGYAISPALCIELAPALSAYIPEAGRARWTDVIEAAFQHRGHLGISRYAWVQSCETVGRETSAVIVAVVAMRQELGEVRGSAGGLFHAMVQRAADGSLRLDKTLHRLVRLRTLGSG